tara:strand:+ start:47 stop:349 length:303 start_codon:yes stop_codon:yes gene_type:complete
METAKGIETNLWNKILKQLVADHWIVKFKYDNFDAGIDYDLVILKKGGEEILFGWDNWFEGEIQCSLQRMKDIERIANQKFKKGEPENLKPEIIKLYRKS